MEEKFPIFMELVNGNSIYRIDSLERMEEIQVIGSKYAVFVLEAKIYPDRVRIADMISNEGKHWNRLDARTFVSRKQKIEADKTLIC